MAYFFRMMIRKLAYIAAGALVALLIGFCTNAKAAYTAPIKFYDEVLNTYHATAEERCMAKVPERGGIYTGVEIQENSDTVVCLGTTNGQPSTYGDVKRKSFCANETPKYQAFYTYSAPRTCTDTCVSPQVVNPQTGACAEPPNNCQLTAGQYINSVYSASSSTFICRVGCEMRVIDSVCTSGVADGGCSSRVQITGQTCVPTPEIPSDLPPDPMKECLAAGNSYGQVNGITTCVKSGTSGSPPIETKSSGGKTVTNGSGTTNTTTNTTNNGDTVTTTTTTTVNGGTPTTESKEQDKKGFCEENPTSKICKDDEKSSFSGSCSAAFSCEGDAINCATAKAINQQKCDNEKAVTDSKIAMAATTAKPLGDKLINAQYSDDVQSFIDGSANQTMTMPTSLSESGTSNFSGQEVQDLSVTVLGRSLNLEFSKANFYLNLLGYILLGLAYMSAYKIVSGAV